MTIGPEWGRFLVRLAGGSPRLLSCTSAKEARDVDEYWQRPPAEGPYDASTGRGWRAQRTRWFRWVFAAALFVILG